MARELNREIFGNLSPMGGKEREGVHPAPQASYAKADEVKVIHLHIENMNKRMKEFESHLELLGTKVDDLMAQSKQRFERVQGHFKNQTEMVKNGFSDFHGKMAQVVSRVNERKVSENVIKEMVERQASLVQTFEVRMSQLQKIISEQEMQLINSRTELKEALSELARLKKL